MTPKEMTDEKFDGLKTNIEICLKEIARLQAIYKQQTGKEYRPGFVVDDTRHNPANVKKMILEQAEENKIVYMTLGGLMIADLDDFLKQSAEGILYDLNRDRVTVLTFLDDPKWINDLAAGQVITRLKEYVEKGEL